jgi:hypothetical protein
MNTRKFVSLFVAVALALPAVKRSLRKSSAATVYAPGPTWPTRRAASRRKSTACRDSVAVTKDTQRASPPIAVGETVNAKPGRAR